MVVFNGQAPVNITVFQREQHDRDVSRREQREHLLDIRGFNENDED